jgi:lycopene beta-cyclase
MNVDAVIAGGGLSGLSLAAHLATGGWADRSVLIVDDPGAAPPATRWGFWSSGPDLLDAAVSRTYRQVRVHAGGIDRVLPLGRYRYRVVHRPDLYRVVRSLVAPGYRFVAGRVTRIRDGEVTIDGRTVHADWVFESVTAPPPDTPADARLAFTGWEVRCTRPVFDPDTPVLFDFRTPQRGSARFVYVLPDDPYRALVELTAFVPRRARPPTAAERADALAGYLTDAGEYRILRTESAVLPLRSRAPARGSGRVLRIGARGGLVKASTGYAYQRIQRDSAAIAQSLARHGHPFALPRIRARYRVLDAILLDVLRRDPARLEEAFARLFAANPADRVLRFLDEDTRVPDEARLIASLPPAPYLRALAHRLPSRSGTMSG